MFIFNEKLCVAINFSLNIVFWIHLLKCFFILSFKFLSKNSKIITLKNYEKINKVIILKDFWGMLFFNSKSIGKIKNEKPDVFHIHGMWGPIQFFFIL